MSRRHRWIRGDWQIAGWLLPRVPGPAGKRRPNTLTALAWWKIFDNLRRSLVPPALLLLLLGGWMLAPEPTGFWTLFVLALLVGPVLCAALLELVRKPRERPWAVHLDAAAKSLGRQLADAGLALVTLPYRAVINLDAILVSGARMLFTRRGLLLWHTPGYARRNAAATLADFCGRCGSRRCSASPAWPRWRWRIPADWPSAGRCCCRGCSRRSSAGGSAGPSSPAAPVLSRAPVDVPARLARRTWRYFEVLVNAEEHWLPPDNFQEVPEPVVASRTSPTNIGLALLANLAAHDFGYLSAGQLLERTDNTLATMEAARALPRPFLQLVRHAHAQAAAAALRVERRQRQSRSGRWSRCGPGCWS